MMKKTIWMIALLVLLMGLSACSPAATNPENARTLSVSGSGEAFLPPDIAYISIGVRTEDARARVALATNTADAQSVADVLTEFGVEAKDIRTTNFRVWSTQKRDLDSNVIGTNYVVDNTVYVTVRDLSTLGELLDAVVDAGANSINNIKFDVDDKTAAVSAAREAAVKNARTQAEEVAAAAGVTLGDVQTISFYDAVPIQVRSAAPSAMAMAESSVPIQAGESSVSVTVSVTYEIK